MKNFKELGVLISGFLAFSSETSASMLDGGTTSPETDSDYKVGVLNEKLPIYLAGHRSHSSHSSHRSHRSSSGGSYPSPKHTPPPTPKPKVPPKQEKPKKSDPLGQPERPKQSVPPKENEVKNLEKVLNNKEKRKNFILRLQLTLSALGYYSGEFTGILDQKTRDSVNKYRVDKKIKKSDKLDVETINSLGILIR